MIDKSQSYLSRQRLQECNDGVSLWRFNYLLPFVATKYKSDKFLADMFKLMIMYSESDIDFQDDIMRNALRYSAKFDRQFSDFVNNEAKRIMKDIVVSNKFRVVGVFETGILLKGCEKPANIPKHLSMHQEFYTKRYAFYSAALYCCWTVEGQFHIHGLPNHKSGIPAFISDLIQNIADVAIENLSPNNLEEICRTAINLKKWNLTDLLLDTKPAEKYLNACDYFRNNLSPLEKRLVFTKDQNIKTIKDTGWPFPENHCMMLDARLCKSYDIDRYITVWYNSITVLLRTLLDFEEPPSYQYWHDTISPKLLSICGYVDSQLPGLAFGNK